MKKKKLLKENYAARTNLSTQHNQLAQEGSSSISYRQGRVLALRRSQSPLGLPLSRSQSSLGAPLGLPLGRSRSSLGAPLGLPLGRSRSSLGAPL